MSFINTNVNVTFYIISNDTRFIKEILKKIYNRINIEENDALI